MSSTSQVFASFSRSMRIFLRDKAIFVSSIFVPIFFLLILPQVLFHNAPSDVMAGLKGHLVIAMITFLIMTTGISNLASSIAADRNNALYSKLSSMPINKWNEILGRVLTVIVFSTIGSVILITVGLLYGAELVIVSLDLLVACGIGLVITLSSVGIGLMIAGFVRSEAAASQVGIAIVLFNYFIGIILPYGELPEMLKNVSRINPMSSANNMITALFMGQDFVGYDPWNFLDIGWLLGFSGLLFAIGLLLYFSRCWQR